MLFGQVIIPSGGPLSLSLLILPVLLLLMLLLLFLLLFCPLLLLDLRVMVDVDLAVLAVLLQLPDLVEKPLVLLWYVIPDPPVKAILVRMLTTSSMMTRIPTASECRAKVRAAR